MSFDQISNNEKLVDEMRMSIKEGHVHHGYIFEGTIGDEAFVLAKAFAKALLCKTAPGEGCDRCNICRAVDEESHLDMTVIRAEATSGKSKVKSVKDKAVEGLIERLMKKPIIGDRNIAVICDGHTMTSRAANRLLKTLEEPPGGTVIMILTENSKDLLPTVRSRCVAYSVQTFGGGTDDEKVEKAAEKLIDQAAADMPYYKMKPILEKVADDKPGAYGLLDMMEIYIGNALREGSMRDERKAREAISVIEDTRRKIKRNGNIKYAMKKMIIQLGGSL